MFDIARIRKDFPALKEKKDGNPIIYADSACMSLKPQQVIDTLVEYYTKFTACAGRSPHAFSRETTKRYEEAREKVAHFINAEDPADIVWTRNTTEALNLGCGVLSLDGTETIITTSEAHNSNMVKWMWLQDAGKIKLNILDMGFEGNCELECIADAIDECEKGRFLVSFAHVSNVTAGTIDVKSIAELVHDRGGFFMIDAAQSFPHMPVDVQHLDVDLLGVSMHKALGPTGMGFLYGKYDLLEQINPLILGGETVADVHFSPNEIKMLPPPAKFEAGLQNYAGAIACGTTIDYLKSVGMDKIHEYEVKLSKIMLDGLKDLEEQVSVLGPKDPKRRAALAAIDLKGVNPHEVAILMDDMYNIMLRSGYHCSHAYHHQLELNQGTLRPSWYLYNTIEEVSAFIEALKEILDTLA